MTDTGAKPDPEQAGSTRTSSEAWREVGEQFQTMGESLAAAFRTAWENMENRQQLEQVKSSFETMINEFSQVIKETVDSPEAQRARGEAEKAAQSARTAGRQTLEEARPHLVSALHDLRTQIDKMINGLETKETPPPGASTAQSPTDEKQP